MELINRKTTQHLIDTGAVRRVLMKETTGGFLVIFDTSAHDFTLQETKGAKGPRIFRTLGGAVSVLKALNVRYVEMDLGNPSPKQRNLL